MLAKAIISYIYVSTLLVTPSLSPSNVANVKSCSLSMLSSPMGLAKPGADVE